MSQVSNPFLNKEQMMSRVLGDFGVKINTVSLDEGRYFDRYSVRLKSGYRSSKIDRILDDVGMSFKSEATPKGEINLSNGSYDILIQKSKIESPDMMGMFSNLPEDMVMPIALGKDEKGERVYFDLNAIPNVLVAGTTGSGKSVLLHNIVLSLLHNDTIIYLFDPKLVEFSPYASVKKNIFIGHTSSELSFNLKIILSEVKRRFNLFKENGVRNIKEFNNRSPIKLSPIAIVIDEWADLCLDNPSIQTTLCKIAQIGRAAGVSFVLATQRPSAKVISGLIKANFPGRISLKVASATDSRIILDEVGAEKITAKGQGYFIGAGDKKITFRTGYIADIDLAIKEVLNNVTSR